MLTPKQITIFEAFKRTPFMELTYRNIKEFVNEKSNSIIQKAIICFLAENLITKRKLGNLILYKLNLENTHVFSYFDISTNLPQIAKLALRIIKAELSEFSFISIVVFGSYSRGTQNDNSDLDIAIFVNSGVVKKKCELAMADAELKSLLQIDYHVFTEKEMLWMLKEGKSNLGTEIALKNLPVLNSLVFYSILNKGIDNGFKIVYSKSRK